jgi:hypothetical protein
MATSNTAEVKIDKERGKSPKKDRTGKTRHTAISSKKLSAIVEVKLYQLDATVAAPFMRSDKFSFRVAFDGTDKDGRFLRYHRSKCPLITVTADEVLQTENETAQRMLEQFCVPQRTLRDGRKRPSGTFFKDVTETAKQYDTDLDDIYFNKVTG